MMRLQSVNLQTGWLNMFRIKSKPNWFKMKMWHSIWGKFNEYTRQCLLLMANIRINHSRLLTIRWSIWTKCVFGCRRELLLRIFAKSELLLVHPFRILISEKMQQRKKKKKWKPSVRTSIPFNLLLAYAFPSTESALLCMYCLWCRQSLAPLVDTILHILMQEAMQQLRLIADSFVTLIYEPIEKRSQKLKNKWIIWSFTSSKLQHFRHSSWNEAEKCRKSWLTCR